MKRLLGRVLALTLACSGCATPPPPLSRGHLPIAAPQAPSPPDAAAIPPLAADVPVLPAPRPTPPLETYSVVVHNAPVQSLLFALARDAKLNLDIHPDVTGTVTLNALDQTIHELLDRIARQVDMRWEFSGKTLYVVPDTPFLRLYKVDYPNISREASTITSSESQVATTGQGSAGGTGNSSNAQVRNVSNNRFWDTLLANLRDLLRETDRLVQEGPAAAQANAAAAAAAAPARAASSAASAAAAPAPAAPRAVYREAASVIANPETGVISVRATARQHQRVREFIDQVVRSSRRQVLIEATIVEVGLTQDYQQGINWSLIRQAVGGNTDLSIVQAPSGALLTAGGNQPFLGAIDFARRGSNFDLTATVRLLESFGSTKVLSSPKVSVMNNQSALLKVVDNKVYFTISVTPGERNQTTGALITAPVYTTQVNTVPIGFLMNVTPQVGDDDTVTLNLRPTVSRITGYATDPSPALAQAGVTNRIPEVQTREFESIMKVRDGQVAVLGGLMQDDQNHLADQVPGLGNLPVVGEALRYRNQRSVKSELVIFLRPTILRDNSIDGDLSFIRQQLPSQLQAPRGRP